MSKDFDTTLSDALDLAARAARTAGPEAARIRGRKRTMHQRIALSTAAFVLVAVGATTAFAFASSSGGHTPHLTGGSPHVTTSASPTTGPTTTPTTSPTAGTTASGSTSQTTSSSATSSPASSQPTVADPHQVVSAAWLSPAEMPFAGTFSWKATQNSAPAGDQLTPTVSYVQNVASYQALTACADPTKLLTRTIGGQLTEYTATSGTISRQFVFFFSDNASAQQTFTWLQSQYSSACLVSGPAVQVTRTGGNGATSAAWLTVKTSKSGPVDLSPYNREYFVVRGSTIAYVEIESTATLPTTYNDAAQISTIASHLCVYGGSCD